MIATGIQQMSTNCHATTYFQLEFCWEVEDGQVISSKIEFIHKIKVIFSSSTSTMDHPT